ncbi:MAG TPA: tetratricopeptide repeat protein [Anaerolineaceae bacterium]|nr:tetratricopeptide repeat protein [Anaerolineaceae bacterium]
MVLSFSAPSPDLLPHNLPVNPGGLVGRESELRALRQRLQNARLVTLVGPGGVGKTRLALQAAWDHLPNCPQGAYWVGLETLENSDFLVAALAEALNFTFFGAKDPKTQLLDHLRARKLLLVLDNCEHLLSGSSLFSEIISAAPGVTILATSRVRLSLENEWVIELEGLPFPHDESTPGLEEYDALQLFIQRTRSFHGVPAGEQWLFTAARICRQVDGIPLALEMAASWSRALSLEDITAEIARNLDFLNTNRRDLPERHRSLRAVFDGSWQLLSDPERDICKRLSLFQGSFRRDAAGQVAGASLGALAALVDADFLKWDPSGGRYHMHPLVHQYVAEKLSAEMPAPAQETLRNRHAVYYLGWLAEYEPLLNGRNHTQSMFQITAEWENIRQAWDWAVRVPLPAQIAAGLNGIYRLCEGRGWYNEGELALHRSFEALNRAEDQFLAARARMLRAYLLHLQGKGDTARLDLEQSLEFFLACGAIEEAATCQDSLANIRLALGQYAEAEAGFLRALELLKDRNTPLIFAQAQACEGLSILYASLGNFPEAETYGAQALSTYRQLGNRRGEASQLQSSAQRHLRKGAYTQAFANAQAGLEIMQEMGHLSGQARCLDILGGALLYQGKYDEARRFQEQSLSIKQTIGERVQVGQSLNNLGFNDLMLGDFVHAAERFESALVISRELNRRAAQVTNLDNLAMLYLFQENAQCARPYAEEALRIASEINSPQEKAGALSMMAQVLVSLEQFDQAISLYRQAETIYRASQIQPALLEIQAGLVRALLGSDLPQAKDLAESVWSAIQATPQLASGTDQPFLLYWTCYQVFQAAKDERATQVLDIAHQLLQESAARISNPALRSSYLENIPIHRFIHAEKLRRQKPESAPPLIKAPTAQLTDQLIEPLTRRELDVLRCMAEGYSDKEIAARLHLNLGTVKVHAHHIYEKLEVTRRQLAVRRARELGLLA